MLVTWLKVPAFIATLTMLFVGRGMVLGLTGGKTIAYEIKAGSSRFFALGEGNALGFNNQILVFVLVAIVGGIVLARPVGATRPTRSAATRWRRSMPASTRDSCASAGSCSRPCAPRWPA